MPGSFTVTAIAVDPQDGTVVGEPRAEVVDTDANELFAGLDSEWEVEDAYQAFWNRLDSEWETDFPKGHEKVFVLSVVRA